MRVQNKAQPVVVRSLNAEIRGDRHAAFQRECARRGLTISAAMRHFVEECLAGRIKLPDAVNSAARPPDSV